MKEPISISFCINDKYAQHLAVVITSILANNPEDEFVFHVLHSPMPESTIEKVKRLETMYPRHKIVFHCMDGEIAAKFPIPEGLEHVSNETYYRYFLPEVLKDEDRTIYSDVDVLCRLPIGELRDYDLKGNLFGAIRNYIGETTGYYKMTLPKYGLKEGMPYFFTGFLVMDLKALREGGYQQKFIDLTNKEGANLAYIDLDVMNIICQGKILEMDESWNCTSHYKPFRKDIKIWHFPGALQKPWCPYWRNITWIPYLYYLLKSPYADKAKELIINKIKGFFYFKYTKKGATRHLVCGVRVWRSRKRG